MMMLKRSTRSTKISAFLFVINVIQLSIGAPVSSETEKVNSTAFNEINVDNHRHVEDNLYEVDDANKHYIQFSTRDHKSFGLKSMPIINEGKVEEREAEETATKQYSRESLEEHDDYIKNTDIETMKSEKSKEIETREDINTPDEAGKDGSETLDDHFDNKAIESTITSLHKSSENEDVEISEDEKIDKENSLANKIQHSSKETSEISKESEENNSEESYAKKPIQDDKEETKTTEENQKFSQQEKDLEKDEINSSTIPSNYLSSEATKVNFSENFDDKGTKNSEKISDEISNTENTNVSEDYYDEILMKTQVENLEIPTESYSKLENYVKKENSIESSEETLHNTETSLQEDAVTQPNNDEKSLEYHDEDYQGVSEGTDKLEMDHITKMSVESESNEEVTEVYGPEQLEANSKEPTGDSSDLNNTSLEIGEKEIGSRNNSEINSESQEVEVISKPSEDTEDVSSKEETNQFEKLTENNDDEEEEEEEEEIVTAEVTTEKEDVEDVEGEVTTVKEDVENEKKYVEGDVSTEEISGSPTPAKEDEIEDKENDNEEEEEEDDKIITNNENNEEEQQPDEYNEEKAEKDENSEHKSNEYVYHELETTTEVNEDNNEDSNLEEEFIKAIESTTEITTTIDPETVDNLSEDESSTIFDIKKFIPSTLMPISDIRLSSVPTLFEGKSSNVNRTQEDVVSSVIDTIINMTAPQLFETIYSVDKMDSEDIEGSSDDDFLTTTMAAIIVDSSEGSADPNISVIFNTDEDDNESSGKILVDETERKLEDQPPTSDASESSSKASYKNSLIVIGVILVTICLLIGYTVTRRRYRRRGTKNRTPEDFGKEMTPMKSYANGNGDIEQKQPLVQDETYTIKPASKYESIHKANGVVLSTSPNQDHDQDKEDSVFLPEDNKVPEIKQVNGSTPYRNGVTKNNPSPKSNEHLEPTHQPIIKQSPTVCSKVKVMEKYDYDSVPKTPLVIIKLPPDEVR